MLLSNKIVELVGYKYFWKENQCPKFLHRDSYQRKMTCTTTADWLYTGVPSRAQTCLNLLEGRFGRSDSGMAALKIIRNKS